MVRVMEQVKTEDKRWCVYMHTNKINNKVYVGQTCVKPSYRWRNGEGYSNGSWYFYNAIKKYGWDNFEHIIFAENLTKEEADHMEMLLIALYDTTNREKGYNLTKGGGGCVGLIPSEESRQKMSESHKARWTDELRAQWSERYSGQGNPMYGVSRYGSDNPMFGVRRYGEDNPMYGKHLSDEAKRKIGDAHKKVNLSEETLIKRSEKAKERFSIPENNPMYGKSHTEETRQLMSKKAKARCTDEWRAKMSQSLKGKFAGDKNPNYGKGQPVVQLNNDMSIICVFISATAAEKYTDVLASSIRFCCIGKYKHAGEYKWRYLYDQTRNDGTIIPGAISLNLITEEEALAQLNTKQND